MSVGIREILTTSPLRVLFRHVTATADLRLIDAFLEYIDRYIAFHELSAAKVLEFYSDFIRRFDDDLDYFARTGLYPLPAGRPPYVISRVHYDVVLLLSTVLTAHRYRIMALVDSCTESTERALVVGCGPGLEIALIKDRCQHLLIYEPSISPFVHAEHPDVHLVEGVYEAQDGQFDAIYLIELLEHLAEPYFALDSCAASLRPGGRLLVTTATDLPQFDHLYNFPLDVAEFSDRAGASRLEILFQEIIRHQYICSNIAPSNTFVVLRRSPAVEATPC